MDNGTTVPRPHMYVCPLNWSSSTHLPLSGSSSRPPHSPERVPSAGRGGVCRAKQGMKERERECERRRGEFRATFLILHNTYDFDYFQSGYTVAKLSTNYASSPVNM